MDSKGTNSDYQVHLSLPMWSYRLFGDESSFKYSPMQFCLIKMKDPADKAANSALLADLDYALDLSGYPLDYINE